RYLDHGREVEVLDRCRDHARRAGRGRPCSEVRIHLLELPHLAIGSPAKIAVARPPQIYARKLFEAARGIEARRHFVCERFVLDEAIVTRRPDRLFVEARRVPIAALDASELCARQRGAVLEILWAMLRPELQLLVMRSQSIQVLLSLGWCGIATGGLGQRTVKAIIGGCEH